MHPLSKRLLSLPEDIFHNGPPRPVEELDELDAAVGARLPDDYRAPFLEVGPWSVKGPRIYLGVHLVEDVLGELHDDVREERMPGILMIGGDGGDYGYFYDPKGDLGHGAFALFFVELGTLTFEASIFVASSLTEAVERVLAGEDFYDLPRLGPR